MDNNKYDGEIIDMWTSVDKHTLFIKTLNSNNERYIYVKTFPNELHGLRSEDTNDVFKLYKDNKSDNTTSNKINKIRPDATAEYDYGVDGRDGHYIIKYSCPCCNKRINKNDIACTNCGQFFDWSMRAEIKVTNSVVWVP